MSQPSDTFLIKQAQLGDQSAFEILVGRHQQFLLSVAFRMLGNRADAMDVAQEVFIQLWKNLNQYQSQNKLTTWLYRITINKCLDILKSSTYKNNLVTGDIRNLVKPSSLSNPEKVILDKELMITILNLVHRLSPKQKAVFVLIHFEGLTQSEVAKILGKPAGNIKSNLFYANQKMGEWLAEEYELNGRM